MKWANEDVGVDGHVPHQCPSGWVTILREAGTEPVPNVAKEHGVSSQTIYRWRKHCGSLAQSGVKRVRQLEQENSRLKKMVADRDLEIDVLKETTRTQWGWPAGRLEDCCMRVQ